MPPKPKPNRKELRRQKFGKHHPGDAPVFKITEKDRLTWEARETLKVINDWEYERLDKHIVRLPDMPASVTIPANQAFGPGPEPRPMFADTAIEVIQTDTLGALDGLDNPCALVFASGRKPGGGWLTGAKAQEEDICRCSALWLGLKDSPMYADNKKHMPGLYSDAMVYCPGVPVFKDAKGFLPEPRVAAFVASPAVNVGAVLPGVAKVGIDQLMLTRMTKILRVMHHYGHTDIVLGSYGCGVFKNDIRKVAKWFMDLLQGPFRGHFKRVRFACIDPVHVRVFSGCGAVISSQKEATSASVDTAMLAASTPAPVISVK